MEHDIKRLEKKIERLEASIASIAHLPRGFGVIIHNPGWTSIAEFALVEAGLDSVQTQIETASEHLKRLIDAAAQVAQCVESDPCADIIQRLNQEIQALGGIPVQSVAGWKAQLLTCLRQGKITEAQYTAALNEIEHPHKG
jgi:hypothetical protein